MPIQIEMEMPKSCPNCPFYIEGSGARIDGIRLGGKCNILKIKDMDGNTIDHQTVIRLYDDITTAKRNKHCPLQAVKE